MTTGTKSVLFGAHCWFLHPLFVAAAWTKLYGFPWDIRLWFAFALHDIGYIFAPEMDGPVGTQHPRLGAKIMGWLFDRQWIKPASYAEDWIRSTNWHDFTLYHSRHFAKMYDKPYSRLCVADKLVPALMPWWIYIPMATWSGEIHEYIEGGKAARNNEAIPLETRLQLSSGDARQWFKGLQDYMALWAYAHKDGEDDTWTTKRSAA